MSESGPAAVGTAREIGFAVRLSILYLAVMDAHPSRPWTRRRFVAGASLAAAGVNLITTRKGAAGDSVILGEGEHRYEVIHDWPQLPGRYSWQTTHNVAVDGQNRLYVIHEGRVEQPDHPSIFVFDDEGAFVRAFGSRFQGGGHGLEVRREPDGDYLYVTAYQHLKTFAKLTLEGEVVWQRYAPMESGVYAEDEATKPEKIWGRDRFMPTNFAFPGDGGFFLADGYGAHTVHRYDADGTWRGMIGSHGEADGQFNLPHGLWIDDRDPGDPQLVVADRANGRLQWFGLEGEHRRTQDGFILPANIDRRGDILLAPDLSARITLLDGRIAPSILGRTQPGASRCWRIGRPCDALRPTGGRVASCTRTMPVSTRRGTFSWPSGCRADRITKVAEGVRISRRPASDRRRWIAPSGLSKKPARRLGAMPQAGMVRPVGDWGHFDDWNSSGPGDSAGS